MKKLKIVAVATLVVAVGAIIFAGVAFAQGPTPRNPIGRIGEYFEQMRDAIASKLGIERADLDVAVQEARQQVIEQAVADGQLTQEQAERILSRQEDGFGPGVMGPARGKRGHFGGRMGGRMGDQEVLAEQLGLTVDELAAELQAGKTIAELAEEKGVDLQTVYDATNDAQVEAIKANIQQAVEEGRMTQDQADWMLQGLEQGFMPGERGFAHGQRGRFGGRPDQSTP